VLLSLLFLLLFSPLPVVLLFVPHDDSQLVIFINSAFLVLVGSIMLSSLMGGGGLVGFGQILQELVVFICNEVQTAGLPVLFNEVLELTKDFGLRDRKSINVLKVF